MSRCPRCHADFGCGMVDQGTTEPCWCTQIAVLPRNALGDDGTRCYCPTCLRYLSALSKGDGDDNA